MRVTGWTIAFWLLLICWVTGAILFMARIQGGFLTNYLSDFTFPAWFYIYIRGLSSRDGRLPNLVFFKNWFGLTPERAIISILVVGVVSEVMTYYWPNGLIRGTFDYLDIFAYAFGLLVCYYFDKQPSRKKV